MVELLGFLFTLGGISGFLGLFVHSILMENYNGWQDTTKSWNYSQSLFIFVGGFLSAFSLELTLVHLFRAYDYTNLPLTILTIPIVIPMGWVITFYMLQYLARDISKMIAILQDHGPISHVVIATLLAMFFGFAIEIIARISGFWIFHFNAPELFGVPVIVALAWCLSVMVFTSGVEIYIRLKKNRFGIILIVLESVINIFIGWLLMSFTTHL